MKHVLLAAIISVLVASVAGIGTYASFSDIETSSGNYLQTGGLDLQLADWSEMFGVSGDSVTQTWYYAGSYPPGMKPGDSLESCVYLQNVGNLEGDHLDIYCVIKNSELDWDTDAEHDAEYAKVTGRDDDDDGLVDEDWLDGVDNDGDGLVDEDLRGGDDDVPLLPGYGIFDKDKVMIISYMKYQNSPPAIDIVEGDGKIWDTAYMADVDGDGVITLYDLKKHGVSNLPTPVSGLASFSMKVTFADDAGDEYQGDRTNMTLIFALMQ